MTKRIFRAISLVALSVFLAALVLIMGALYSYFSHVQRTQLRIETTLAAAGVAQSGRDFLNGLETTDYRITWIAPDGTVWYDSQTDPEKMENHLEREEVRQAVETGYGESVRDSETLLQRLLYAAQRLPDGSVVRLSCAQSSVLYLLLGMGQPIMLVVLLALVLSLLLASRVSARVVEPLNHLNLEDPLANEGCDELSPLLHRIASQQRQLKTQEEALSHRREEFDAVTVSMNEGLVLLNPKGTVLSINGAAQRILGIGQGCVGQDILVLNRTLEVQELLEMAFSGRHGEKTVTMDGRDYQMDTNPVLYEGAVSGAVLLIFDVTEKKNAEQMRREFTANVSHELRTPLHTISGCAELLCGGMVKPEDEGRFHEQIYAESRRMIRLVEDIINLSQLDEGARDMKRQDADLYALAEEAVRSLSPEAEEASVTLRLSGQSACLPGIPQLLSGIVTNLCDNAVKYNRPGGEVEVTVEDAPTAVTLTVRDNGIGIPPEHQSRVFERFYRVDKSRSKAVGGTGLGLSIVKHAVMIHHGTIRLESIPGAGTTITVSFPKEEKQA